MTNGTSKPRNRASNERSSPGQPVRGRPNQAASSTGVQFSILAGAATTVPATMPKRGAHSRAAPREYSDTRTMVTKAVKATSGRLSDAGSPPGGTSASMFVVMGNRLTAISMITVPPTVGVISRRKNDSRAENRNCTSDDTTTRIASSDRPPAATAAADTPMNAPDVPM